MLFKRKQVLCSDCGFFCWRVQHASGEGPYRFEELGRHTRDDFQVGNFSGSGEDQDSQEYYQVHCLRRQWLWSQYIKKAPHYVDVESIRQPRKCVYYIHYQPAFGPEEHKELKREAETRRTMLISSLLSGLIGALIGAAAATIVYLISR